MRASRQSRTRPVSWSFSGDCVLVDAIGATGTKAAPTASERIRLAYDSSNKLAVERRSSPRPRKAAGHWAGASVTRLRPDRASRDSWKRTEAHKPIWRHQRQCCPSNSTRRNSQSNGSRRRNLLHATERRSRWRLAPPIARPWTPTRARSWRDWLPDGVWGRPAQHFPSAGSPRRMRWPTRFWPVRTHRLASVSTIGP